MKRIAIGYLEHYRGKSGYIGQFASTPGPDVRVVWGLFCGKSIGERTVIVTLHGEDVSRVIPDYAILTRVPYTGILR